LKGKTAIVTGAGSVGPGWGNGRATAVRFAEEGAKIFAVDRNPDSVTETIARVKEVGGDLVVHQCDVTNKHVLPIMEKQKSGSIINVASTSGIRFTGAFQVGYAATKAGVIQLSRVVAVQYAPKGVRINTIVPGQLHTPMVEARLARQRAGGDVEALLKQRLAR